MDEINSDSQVRERIRQELIETRNGFHALLESIPPEKYHHPTSNPAWNVGDILYHMSLALRFMPADIRLIRRQKGMPHPPAFIFNKVNEWYTKRGGRKATPEFLAAEYDQAHAGLIAVLETNGEEEWGLGAEYPGWDPLLTGFVTIERLFHYPAEHFQAHKEDLISLHDEDTAGDYPKIPNLDQV